MKKEIKSIDKKNVKCFFEIKNPTEVKVHAEKIIFHMKKVEKHTKLLNSAIAKASVVKVRG